MPKKIYASVIDSILDDIAPNEAQLQKGIDVKDLSEGYIDKAFLKEIAGDSEHTSIPGGNGMTASVQEDWAGRSQKVLAKADGLLHSIGAPDDAFSVTDAKVRESIRRALNSGISPLKVTAMLNKLAEQAVFNRTYADDFLKSQSGLLGLAYIEPNHFMGSCDKTFNKLKSAGRKVTALAVKACDACVGCTHCKTASEGLKRCALYGKPIVETASDVRNLLKEKKYGTKKAALSARHNGMQAPELKQAPERTLIATTTRTAGDKNIVESKTFTAKDVEKQLGNGADLQHIYHGARGQFGSMVASAAVKKFIASLKGSNVKIALRQLDCTLLKRRLAATETIIGESKCASCAMRQGMHCGFTGGTILSFPGMEKVSSRNKIASSGPEVDGTAVLDEYDLTRRASVVIADTKPLDRLDVEMPATFGLNVE
jgi:hypothetical protein